VNPAPRVHETAARGFARAGEDYELGRPGYPDVAVSLLASELGIGPGRTVVDLAAGTGKLTRSLRPLGARLIAVEPVAEMRERLSAALPGVETVDGTAEALPLEPASVDAVLVAQAFHWFDAAAAATEIDRVLRPGGGLAVLRNTWDESVDWVARVQDLVHAYAGNTPRHDTSPWREQVEATGLYGRFAERTFIHVVVGDLDALLARVASISYISALDEHERAHVLDEVRAIVAANPETRGQANLPMPYLTQVAWCRTVGGGLG
jgi:ubiquinone/menaquinone biosynthesis C-methylase UbiE